MPGSVLWLLQDAHAEGKLRREAMAHGIAAHRLVFAPPLPQAAHPARLPELLTHSLAGDADLATALATDAPRLAALRARLVAQRASAPLFDVPADTLALESLFKTMWQRHVDGLPPQAIGATGHPGAP